MDNYWIYYIRKIHFIWFLSTVWQSNWLSYRTMSPAIVRRHDKPLVCHTEWLRHDNCSLSYRSHKVWQCLGLSYRLSCHSTLATKYQLSYLPTDCHTVCHTVVIPILREHDNACNCHTFPWFVILIVIPSLRLSYLLTCAMTMLLIVIPFVIALV